MRVRRKQVLLSSISGLAASLAAACALPHDPRVDFLLITDQQRAKESSESRDADQNRAIQNLAQRVGRIEQALSAVAESAQTTPTPKAEGKK
jgi:hypothetical protein